MGPSDDAIVGADIADSAHVEGIGRKPRAEMPTISRMSPVGLSHGSNTPLSGQDPNGCDNGQYPSQVRRQSEPVYSLAALRPMLSTSAVPRAGMTTDPTARPPTEPLPGRSSLSEDSVPAKLSARLRLPSFEMLGIAAPHPDRLRMGSREVSLGIPQRTHRMNCKSLPDAYEDRRIVDGLPVDALLLGGSRSSTTSQAMPMMLTPPDEDATFDFGSSPQQTIATIDSTVIPQLRPPSNPEPPMSTRTTTSAEPCSTGSSSAVAGLPHKTQPLDQAITSPSTSSQESGQSEGSPDMYLRGALDLIVTRSLTGNADNAVRVLCQSLPQHHQVKHEVKGGPSPPDEGRMELHGSLYTPASVLELVVENIGFRSSFSGQMPYVHLSHAVPPALVNLECLPSSPPLSTAVNFDFSSASSPGYFTAAATLGDGGSSPGYFRPLIFSSVVPTHEVAPRVNSAPLDLAHYDAWQRSQETAPLPSPNPIVPPLSLHISILERYIPPPSPEEDQKIFSPWASTLVDRLFELSPHRGSLLFIYPTKTGAETFSRDCLGPILAPLLRGLMSVHHLPQDFCESIDHMRAIEFMMEFEGLRSKVQNLCARSGEKKSNETGDDLLDDGRVRLVYADREMVRLQPRVWREWWVVQEASRVRRICDSFFSMGFRKPKDITSGDLYRSIIEGVRSNIPVAADADSTGSLRAPSVEVAVFVLQRNG
ncbi:MAG: hypothetical protein M1817_001907 [Caeruleum heppii]|nr:MAG: hypothetical protein M1817_001907 [Caeruleum heppii]